MIYLLYGDDTYRSLAKLRELVAEYTEKTGSALNLYRFDAEEEPVVALEQMLRGGSLFQEKKLVVTKFVLSEGNACEVLLRSAEDLSRARDCIVFLWERGLGKAAEDRLKKLASYLAKTQEFKPLRGDEMRRWIYDEAAKRNIRLGAEDFIRLASFGSDLWALANELDKLRVGGATSGKRQATSSVFHLGDTFFLSTRDALRHLFSLFSQGEDEFGIFSYLANHARTLLAVRSYADEGKPVAALHRIHPFVIKKASAMVRMLPVSHFHLSLRNFFEEDWKIKTGVSGLKESLLRLLLHKRNQPG